MTLIYIETSEFPNTLQPRNTVI